jgi:cytochrome c553
MPLLRLATSSTLVVITTVVTAKARSGFRVAGQPAQNGDPVLDAAALCGCCHGHRYGSLRADEWECVSFAGHLLSPWEGLYHNGERFQTDRSRPWMNPNPEKLSKNNFQALSVRTGHKVRSYKRTKPEMVHSTGRLWRTASMNNCGCQLCEGIRCRTHRVPQGGTAVNWYASPPIGGTGPSSGLWGNWTVSAMRSAAIRPRQRIPSGLGRRPPTEPYQETMTMRR